MPRDWGSSERRTLGPLMPDPPMAVRHVPIVSVDDHFVEPGSMFVDRVPSKWRDEAPRIVEVEDGGEAWQFGDHRERNLIVTTSIVGRPIDEWSRSPVRLDECRPGAYDVMARIRDLDLAGIAMSMCFPSVTFGFAGQRVNNLHDRELALACVRAYNDWIAEEWVGPAPERHIPQQIAWLHDPVAAAQEIRRNAARGFRAVAFSENPEKLGLPSLHTDHWWPFFEACVETDTVVDVHIGSSSTNAASAVVSSDCPFDVATSMFGVNALLASVDWVYSGIPSRFPDLRIVMSESGIDWVPFVIDRLKRFAYQSEATQSWAGRELSPVEVFQRNFWFTTLEDPLGLELRHHIGVDKIMVECDYPHPDTQWPDIQERLRVDLHVLDHDEVNRVAWQNACDVYRVELPAQFTVAS